MKRAWPVAAVCVVLAVGIAAWGLAGENASNAGQAAQVADVAARESAGAAAAAPSTSAPGEVQLVAEDGGGTSAASQTGEAAATSQDPTKTAAEAAGEATRAVGDPTPISWVPVKGDSPFDQFIADKLVSVSGSELAEALQASLRSNEYVAHNASIGRVALQGDTVVVNASLDTAGATDEEVANTVLRCSTYIATSILRTYQYANAWSAITIDYGTAGRFHCDKRELVNDGSGWYFVIGPGNLLPPETSAANLLQPISL